MCKSNIIVGLLLLLSLFRPSYIAASEYTIKEINRISSLLEKKIQTNTLFTPVFMIEATIGDPSEGSPPKLSFFFDEQDKLVAVYAIVGHESWSKKFFYFFNEGRFIKYLEVIDRPDNPPRKAIIYDHDGRILWNNTDKAEVDPQEVVNIFNSIISSLRSFSKY